MSSKNNTNLCLLPKNDIAKYIENFDTVSLKSLVKLDVGKYFTNLCGEQTNNQEENYKISNLINSSFNKHLRKWHIWDNSKLTGIVQKIQYKNIPTMSDITLIQYRLKVMIRAIDSLPMLFGIENSEKPPQCVVECKDNCTQTNKIQEKFDVEEKKKSKKVKNKTKLETLIPKSKTIKEPQIFVNKPKYDETTRQIKNAVKIPYTHGFISQFDIKTNNMNFKKMPIPKTHVFYPR